MQDVWWLKRARRTSESSDSLFRSGIKIVLALLLCQQSQASDIPVPPTGTAVTVTTRTQRIRGTVQLSKQDDWVLIQTEMGTDTFVRLSAIETITTRRTKLFALDAELKERAEERTFNRRFELAVPARGLGGDPPSREKEFLFQLPRTYELKRDANGGPVRVVRVNLGGLSEYNREFSLAENGVRLKWTLRNSEMFPISGRTAFIELEVTGIRQQGMSLSAKYRQLRQRFFENFYFQGLVAEYVDGSVPDKKVKFADQTIYMGQALLVMATELAILRSIGEDLTETQTIVDDILDAIDRLDTVAEPRFGRESALDGFFVRDDVSGPADPRLNGRFSRCDSDWQFPERESASPSGDQVFGLMYGLWAVVHFSGDEGLADRAKAISSRLYDYARRNQFVLLLPSGEPTRRGSDVRWLSSLLHGMNHRITGQDLFEKSKIIVFGSEVSLRPIAAFWDDTETPLQISRLAGRTLRVPVVGHDAELNSFALHIMLMAIAPSDVWSQNELEQVAISSKHELAVLFYCVAHDANLPVSFRRSTITQMLDSCPVSGPRSDLDVNSGWNKDNRWIRCTNLGEPSDGSHEYNGLDWMILHNLDQLVFVGS